MLVRCIDNSEVDGLSRGQIYEVLVKEDRYSTAYAINDDNGEVNHFFKERFLIVEGEVKEMKTEMTKKELVFAFLNEELEEGQVWVEKTENDERLMITVKLTGLKFFNGDFLTVCKYKTDMKFILRQEWKLCTWAEAAQAKAEGKTVKRTGVYSRDGIYDNKLNFVDQDNFSVKLAEMQKGKWYIKGE